MGDVAALFDRLFPGNPPSPEAADLRGLIQSAGALLGHRPPPVPPRAWPARSSRIETETDEPAPDTEELEEFEELREE